MKSSTTSVPTYATVWLDTAITMSNAAAMRDEWVDFLLNRGIPVHTASHHILIKLSQDYPDLWVEYMTIRKLRGM